MRVLFIEQELSYEPQGIMSMSSVLKGAGHEVALAVAEHEDPIRVACDFRADVVGFSVLTGSQRWALECNRQVRAALDPLRTGAGCPAALSVFGGPHPTFFPDIIAEPGVDGVCIGEGEGALLDLMNSLAESSGGGQAPCFRPDIPNWWFKVDGNIVKNAVRPLVEDLSALPLPDRALVYTKSPDLANSRIKHFMSSRGCPYDCTYCFNHAFYDIYRGARRGYQRSVDNVIGEVNLVRSRWPLEQVVFVDDLFILHDDWLQELAEKWPAQVGLPFFCNVRANLIVKDPHKVELLRRAGAHTLSMGIEAASERIKRDLLRRRMSNEEVIEAGRIIRGAGLQLTATNILALPTSTLEDDFATMQLNAQARVSYAHAFLFQPYPGTELGRKTKELGLLSGTVADIGEIAWDHTILAFPEEHKRQVEHLQRLFPLGVEWPWLEPLIRRLIRLPHNKVIDTAFWWLHKLHKGFAILTRVHPVRVTPRQLFVLTKHFFIIKS